MGRLELREPDHVEMTDAYFNAKYAGETGDWANISLELSLTASSAGAVSYTSPRSALCAVSGSCLFSFSRPCLLLGSYFVC